MEPDYPAIGAIKVHGWVRETVTLYYGGIPGWWWSDGELKFRVEEYRPHEIIAQAMAVLQVMAEDGWRYADNLCTFSLCETIEGAREIVIDKSRTGDLGADTALAIMMAISKAVKNTKINPKDCLKGYGEGPHMGGLRKPLEAVGERCYCSETSARNCPTHQNDSQKGA